MVGKGVVGREWWRERVVEGRGSGGEGVVALGAHRRSHVVVLVPHCHSRVLVLGAHSCSCAVVVGPRLLVLLAPCCHPRVAKEGGARGGEGVEEGAGHRCHSHMLVLGPHPFVVRHVDTSWAIGLVVFTGAMADTKVMLNGGYTPSKQSKIEGGTNFSIIVNLLGFCNLPWLGECEDRDECRVLQDRVRPHNLACYQCHHYFCVLPPPAAVLSNAMQICLHNLVRNLIC